MRRAVSPTGAGLMIRSASVGVVCALIAVASAKAQLPLPFSDARPASEMDSSLRASLQAKAGRYPLVGFRFYGADSALLVFEDSALIATTVRAHKWMFGPPVTTAEADG